MPLCNLCARWPLAIVFTVLLCIGGNSLRAEALPRQAAPRQIAWVKDYTTAFHLAKEQGKMVFVYFEDSEAAHKPFADKVLTDPKVAKLLGDFVCVKAPLDATVVVEGKTEVLLKYASFRPLEGKSGVAIVDLAHKDAVYYGYVVSVVPFPDASVLSGQQLEILLTLPPGTRSQRDVAYKAKSCNCAPSATADSGKSAPQPSSDQIPWFTSYAKAVKEASAKRKMMVLLFANDEPQCRRLETETLADPGVRAKLRDYVCVRLPLNAKILSEGKELTLIEQSAFQEMLGRPGVAILDFVNMECAYGGCVVSTFPLTQQLWYDAEKMKVILDLPPGSLTQRTLVYAVRIHPEHPQSTVGKLDKNLLSEAENHSQHQANIRLQGHHNWDMRFHRINAILPFGLVANEVCAESWPGQHLVEAAIECVRCWRTSSGHWSSVVAPHRLFGYDMKRGGNGVWYATGIFGKNR